ncbi:MULTISPECIES: phosphoribosylanthranilate isomerase [unclassified Carboxylicivirga]|uniref:phosphoribosylanthranilate isomerase n=1 Tax=Carboxylicivirga TaxID=1628153 RepID=UPI003D3264C3
MNGVPEIKVCGLRQGANIEQVMALQPDYLGFIFYRHSPRFVTEVPVLPQDVSIRRVGVFVNAGEQEIDRQRVRFGLDLLQLHGSESPELCHLLRQSGAQVMKAFQVDECFDFHQTLPYQDCCDFFLFDTATRGYGGSGRKFSWQLLEKYNNDRPVFLSGGIGPNDVQAIRQIQGLNLKAIDVNSQFEIKPGLKDIDKLAKFIAALRGEK